MEDDRPEARSFIAFTRSKNGLEETRGKTTRSKNDLEETRSKTTRSKNDLEETRSKTRNSHGEEILIVCENIGIVILLYNPIIKLFFMPQACIGAGYTVGWGFLALGAITAPTVFGKKPTP